MEYGLKIIGPPNADGEIKTLFTAIRGVLREAVAFKALGHDYPARFLVQHREEGDHCPRCGGVAKALSQEKSAAAFEFVVDAVGRGIGE